MSIWNPRLHPYTVITGPIPDATADATWNFFKFPGVGKVISLHSVNDATIATATNTLQVCVGSRGTTGTSTFTTVANFAAATGWTADLGRSGTLTTANCRIGTSGTWLAYRHTEAGTGGETRMVVQVDYIVGATEDSA